jgi:hypothetical protein
VPGRCMAVVGAVDVRHPHRTPSDGRERTMPEK